MHLSDYMAMNGLRDDDLSVMLGRNRTTVNRLRRGLHLPSLAIAQKIQEVTNGEVSVNDWLDPPKAQP